MLNFVGVVWLLLMLIFVICSLLLQFFVILLRIGVIILYGLYYLVQKLMSMGLLDLMMFCLNDVLLMCLICLFIGLIFFMVWGLFVCVLWCIGCCRLLVVVVGYFVFWKGGGVSVVCCGLWVVWVLYQFKLLFVVGGDSSCYVSRGMM